MLPGSLLDEMFERGDNDLPLHHGRLRSLTVLAACRLIVQVLLLYLYHTKAISLVLLSHMLWLRCRVSISGPHLHSWSVPQPPSHDCFPFSIFNKFGSLGSNSHFQSLLHLHHFPMLSRICVVLTPSAIGYRFIQNGGKKGTVLVPK
jgi:hypothetical protein